MGTLSHKTFAPAPPTVLPGLGALKRREIDARKLAIAYPYADGDAKTTPQHSSRRGKPSYVEGFVCVHKDPDQPRSCPPRRRMLSSVLRWALS
ncbi:unnamed protein product [Clonostachys solani]|uniref:Uncharacterized protein n=1 Tax=Clonostachys solani TaxID=160281 RepID=A0A9N9ZGC2_9HYPO|nr:unnamed protein product [Clonostachys solani]